MTESAISIPQVAVSQSLWCADEEVSVLRSLTALGVDGIVLNVDRICPTLEDFSSSDSKFNSFVSLFKSLSLTPVAIDGLASWEGKGAIFGNKERQKILLRRLSHSCEVAQALGAEVVTFASPELRHGYFCDSQEDFDKGVAFFGELSTLAMSYGVRIMVEPCPQEYGCDFGCTLSEISDLLYHVSPGKGVGIHLNTSSLLMDPDTLKSDIIAFGGSAHHIDVCDAFMKPLTDTGLLAHTKLVDPLRRMWSAGIGPKWIVAAGRRNRSLPPHSHMLPILGSIDAIKRLYLPQEVEQS